MINYTYLPIFGTGSIFIANWIITMFKNSFFIVLVTVLEKSYVLGTKTKS